MQSDLGKLFIGGISWDTNEDSLKDYFSGYGEVLEAVIMKDRNTGRARGFGFVVFADPAVVERVINEKHIIDGRMVEAKKAVPREDHQNAMMLSRSSNSSLHGSPGQGGRTRKIFVGGLASTVTEADFRLYFEQYGTITDVVVMYDHNTHRPRGFGFITFDSEDAVDKVLLKTFHELNGKVVEVKRAVPKELSPGGLTPGRSSPLSGYSYFNHLNRINNFLDGYNSQAFSPNSTTIGYGLRMDDARFSPIGAGRSGFGPFGSLNFESELNPTFVGNTTSLINSGSYGRGGGMNHPYFSSGNNNNRFANPIGYDGGNGGSSSFFSSASRSLWGGNNNNNNSGGLNFGTNSSGYIGNGSGLIGGNLGNSGINWDSSPHLTNQNGGSILGHVGNLDYGLRGGAGGGGVGGGFDRISSGTAIGDSISNVSYDGAFSDLYNTSSSVYGDPTWHSSNLEREESGAFDYELGNGGGGSDVQTKTSHGYVGGGYGVPKTQSNRG